MVYDLVISDDTILDIVEQVVVHWFLVPLLQAVMVDDY